MLNHDYTYFEAQPALERIKEVGISLVLASSKTEAEMAPLADELGLSTPIICENGGVINWRGLRHSSNCSRTIIGVPRERIRETLNSLTREFRFRSFEELGVEGIAQATGLSPQRALLAAQRQTTEPLIWTDCDEAIDDFRKELSQASLTLTRGGRFWHVAGKVSKGDGMAAVLDMLASQSGQQPTTVAIGDSPIDLSMLNRADWAIVIPQPNGEVLICPEHRRVSVSGQSGSAGWNESVLKWMNSLQPPDEEN